MGTRRRTQGPRKLIKSKEREKESPAAPAASLHACHAMPFLTAAHASRRHVPAMSSRRPNAPHKARRRRPRSRSRIEERVDEKEEWTPQSRWLTGGLRLTRARFSARLSARSSLPAGCLARPSPSSRVRRHRRQRLTPQHVYPPRAATAAVASVTPHGSLLWCLFLAFCSQLALQGGSFECCVLLGIVRGLRVVHALVLVVVHKIVVVQFAGHFE